MLEVEIKSPCGDVDALKERLIKLGGVFMEARTESDIYYNHPSRDFKETDEALRLRSVDGETVLTYKGPKLGGRTKTRLEEETSVQHSSSMKQILEHLGFYESGKVEKQRELYSLRGIEICLDRVVGLGHFVELEKKAPLREEAEKELFALASDLGLEIFETRSYLELLLA